MKSSGSAQSAVDAPIVEVDIERLVQEGYGLARHEGKVWMVPYTAPGDRISVRAAEDRGTWVRGEIDRVLRAGAQRAVAADVCPHATVCGGCSWPHLGLEHQAGLKRELVYETLVRLGRIENRGTESAPVSSPLYYRMRTQFKLVRCGDEVRLGFYRPRSRQVEPIATCQLVAPQTLAKARRLAAALGSLSAFEPCELLVLEDMSGERHVAELVLAGGWAPSGVSGARDLTAVAPSLAAAAPYLTAAALDAGFASLTVRQQASSRRRRSSPAAAGQSKTLFGEPGVMMDLGAGAAASGRDLRLWVSTESFFQVNRFVLPRLLADIDAACDAPAGGAPLGELGDLIDLYAGVGLLGFLLAPRFTRVTQVESAPSAARDARRNRAALGDDNVHLVADTVEAYCRATLPPRGGWILVDPPRAGLSRQVREWLSASAAARLLYLSCNPPSLARDLNHLISAGWQLESLSVYDMFPNTYHAEVLVRLVRLP